MKSSQLFSFEELPFPVVICRKDSGKILAANAHAKLIFGLRTINASIKKIRPAGLPAQGKKSGGYLNFGPVVHKSAKRGSISMVVLRKATKWNGEDCWVDFLHPASDSSQIKNQVIETSLDGFVSINDKGFVRDWNPAAVRIFGWRKSEVVGKKLTRLIIPKEFRKRHTEGFAHFLKTGESRISGKLIEISALHKKGHHIMVELTVTPVREEGAQMFYAFIRDISDRKKKEDDFCESEKNLKRAQTLASIGSWEMFDKSGEMRWSDEFYRIHGLEPGSVKPSTKLRLAMTHPDDRKKLQNAIKEAERSGKPYNIEKRIIKPDGEQRWVQSQGEAFLDPQTGKRKVFGTILDITQRKLANDALSQINLNLSETLIFGKMGRAELNLETLEIVMSKELLMLLDMKTEVPIRTHIDNFVRTFVAPEYSSIIYQKISEGVADGSNRKVVEVEFEMITATRRRIWIAAKGIFSNQVALGILQDITARKMASQQLSNLTDTIPDGFIYEYWHSKDGSEYRINYVSQGCESLFEVKMEEVLKNADSLLSKIHPDDLTPFFKLVEEKRRTPGRFDIDYRIVMDDKRIKWVNGRAAVRVLDDGSTIIEGIALDITRNKTLEQIEQKAKALLSESENNLRAILNASTDFTVFLDTDCKVKLANAQATNGIKLLADRELQVGISFESLLPEKLQYRFRFNFNRALAGTIVDEDREIKLHDINISWLQLRYLPVKDDSGEIIGVSFNASNITARKRAELALKDSEERFKLLYNNTPAMLHSIDREHNLIRVSDYWLQAMGYAREEVLGCPITDFLAPSSQKLAMEQILPSFFETGLTKNVEYEFVTKSGEVLNTILSSIGERDENGDIVKAFSVTTDITEKKRLEKEVEKLAMIASRTSNAVILTDAEGRITWVNDGFERITEYSREEVMKKRPGDFLQGPDTDSGTINFMRNKLKAGEGFKTEVLNYSKSKKEYWLDIEVMPVRDADGQLTGFMAIESDITTLKRAISEMLNTQTRLDTMMNHAPMVVYMKDLQGRYVFHNHAYRAARNQCDLKLHTDYDVLDEESTALIKQKDNDVIRLNEPVSFEHKINDRQYYTIEFPILDVRDRLDAIGGISIDQTERKQAERALLQSEANLKSVVENSETAFVLLNTNLKIVSLNQFAQNLITKIAKRSVTLGDDALNYVSEKRQYKINQVLQSVLSGKRTEYENQFEIDGETRWYHIRFFPVHNSDSVSGIIFAMSDITTRKQSEAEILQSRERLKVISDNLPSVAIYQYVVEVGQTSGLYKYFSEGVEQITGIPAHETINNAGVLDSQMHPDDLKEKQQLVKIAADSMNVFTQDFRFRHRNSEWKWLRTRSQPTRMSDGQIVWNGLLIDITQQKLADETLKESEQRFRTMADAAPVLIWMSGKDKRCDYFNKGWLQFTGRTLERELDSGWADRIHPEDFERCISTYESSFDKRVDFTLEYRMLRYDGQYRWIVDHGTPRFLPNGEFAGYIGSCFDIHDLIETRKKLSDNELRLRTILETEPECVKILNARGELQEMNKAGLDMIEASSLDQVVGHKITALVDEAFRDDFIALNKKVFEGNSGILEFKMKGMKGTPRWLETHAVPMRDASGVITSLLGVTRDVTRRKEVEDILRESEERYRKLFELNPAPTWIFDLNTLAFLQVNNAAMAHYGYSREEFLKMTILDIRPESERKIAMEAVRAMQASSNEGNNSHNRIWKHAKKDGSIIDVEIMSIGFSFEGSPVRLVTVNDVTNKLIGEKKLLTALRDKDLLIKEIHHRVKNNLQLISSILYIRLASMTQGDAKMFLEETRQRIRSIALIHERLLQTESVNQVDISDYLNKLILDLQMTNLSQERKINMQSDIVSANMNLDMAINCGLILNELVTNAAKHAFTSQASGAILIRLSRADDQFEFEIHDDGCGLPDNIKPGSGGFGMQLLDVFLKQLKAEVSILRKPGTTFKIRFS